MNFKDDKLGLFDDLIGQELAKKFLISALKKIGLVRPIYSQDQMGLGRN